MLGNMFNKTVPSPLRGEDRVKAPTLGRMRVKRFLGLSILCTYSPAP